MNTHVTKAMTCINAWMRVVLLLCMLLVNARGFNVDTKNVQIFRGPDGIYFGYSLAMLRNQQGDWLLVGAPKSFDPLQPGVTSPGVLLRCPLGGATSACVEVVVDTSGNVIESGTFYGSPKMFEHDKTDEWLGVAVDVAPNNDRIVVCAHRWKDSKFVARSDLLYMNGLCYELDANFQFPARLMPILVDYNSLVHTIERYPIWAYGALGQSVQYTKSGDSIVMGAPGLNDWHGGFVIEDNLRRNFTAEPLHSQRDNWMIGYSITTANLLRTNDNYIIAGAPRANLNGSVFLFEFKSKDVLNEPLVGDQLGSYFGSVLCTADVNGDDLDDLLVGAPLYASNNTEEGRVYVYINKGMLKLEKQSGVLNGTVSSRARFGSAIANIGDINKDNFNDIAIGAPYEDDGRGCLYIYNGYGDGVWPVFTQRIAGADIDTGLRAFGAAITPRSVNQGTDFAVGAFMSDRAVLLRASPVVSMQTMIYVRPDIITKSTPNIDVVVCFKYTGDATSLSRTLELEYKMLVDTTTPDNSLRVVVVPSKVPHVSRQLRIRIDDFVCDQSIRIFAPYQDIWRDVELEVHYNIARNTTTQCQPNCPILEEFNGNRPTTSNQHVWRKTIQYDKQCGPDNLCETSLAMKVWPLANNGQFIIYGEHKRLEVKVGVVNTGENAYNLLLDIAVVGNLSAEIRIMETSDNVIVDCDLLDHAHSDAVETAIYRCRIWKPYPLKTNGDVTFHLLVPLENHLALGNFAANFTLRTEADNETHAFKQISLPIKTQFALRMEGISDPEQITMGLEKDTNSWVHVQHRHSIKNLGPSPIESRDISVYVPAIVHRDDELVKDIAVELISYFTDPPVKQACVVDVTATIILHAEPTGGYAVTVDCASFPCKTYSCSVYLLEKDQSILVSINMTVSRQLLTRLQVRDTAQLASRVAMPTADGGKHFEEQAVTTFHKTSKDMERKMKEIPVWLIIVSVVSAFLVLLVIVAILIKVGFFRRTKKEEVKELRRRASVFSTATASGADVTSGTNGNTPRDNSRILSSIEETNTEPNGGVDNPLSVGEEPDQFNDNLYAKVNHNNHNREFLNDLSNNLKSRSKENIDQL